MDTDAVWNGEWGRSRDGCIRWGGYCRRKEAVWGVNLGRPIVTNWTSLRTCAKVREPIELSFWGGECVWLRHSSTRRGSRCHNGKGSFGDFHPSWFEWRIFCTEMYLIRA